MTLEERLNEIVEKQQGDAIIPFLQGLTQEERKSQEGTYHGINSFSCSVLIPHWCLRNSFSE